MEDSKWLNVAGVYRELSSPDLPDFMSVHMDVVPSCYLGLGWLLVPTKAPENVFQKNKFLHGRKSLQINIHLNQFFLPLA